MYVMLFIFLPSSGFIARTLKFSHSFSNTSRGTPSKDLIFDSPDFVTAEIPRPSATLVPTTAADRSFFEILEKRDDVTLLEVAAD